VSGELKNVSVVYSLIFFVYSSSMACFGSRAYLFGCAQADEAAARTRRHIDRRNMAERFIELLVGGETVREEGIAVGFYNRRRP
jgi:hypothetical protein